MFKYKKSLKEVNKFNDMISSIKDDDNNSGYRVEISYAHGKLYKMNDSDMSVKIYVTDNYGNYNNKNLIMQIVGANSNENEKLLPCTIHGNPIASKGRIKNIHFNKEELLLKLKAERKHIINSKYGTLKTIEIKDNCEIVNFRSLYQDYIHVYF
ncbi:hypothetical protein [Staphylococcus hyicus]|uniref:hypothetical protein n=1 Tax=Staphylococcus hyicus TaxID=1284 RepID=UPI003132C024